MSVVVDEVSAGSAFPLGSVCVIIGSKDEVNGLCVIQGAFVFMSDEQRTLLFATRFNFCSLLIKTKSQRP